MCFRLSTTGSQEKTKPKFRYKWTLSLDHIAEVIDSLTEKLDLQKYSLYVMDYGASVGYRIAVKHPERIESLIIQSGKLTFANFNRLL